MHTSAIRRPLAALALALAAPVTANETGEATPDQRSDFCESMTGKAARCFALVEAGERWNALYAAGDWDALRTMYEPDAWLMTDRAPALRSADEIVAYLRRFRDRGAEVTFRFEPEDVQMEQPFGFVTAKYWMTATLPGQAEPIRTAGRSLLVYKWRDGGWRLWRDMDNATPDVVPAD